MIKKLLVIVVMGFSILVVPSFTLSSRASAAVAPECDTSSSFLGFPTWYKYLDVGPAINDQGQQIVNESGDSIDECAIIGPRQGAGADNPNDLDWAAVTARVSIAIVEILLRLAAVVAVAFVTYGGFRFITSQGDPESAKSARQTIQNSLIGLVISLVSIAAVTFIGNQFL